MTLLRKMRSSTQLEKGNYKMPAQREKITRHVLALPRKDQWWVAKALLSHLVDEDGIRTQAEIDELWKAEYDQRLDAFKDGLESAIPGEEVFQKLRQRKRK